MNGVVLHLPTFFYRHDLLEKMPKNLWILYYRSNIYISCILYTWLSCKENLQKMPKLSNYGSQYTRYIVVLEKQNECKQASFFFTFSLSLQDCYAFIVARCENTVRPVLLGLEYLHVKNMAIVGAHLFLWVRGRVHFTYTLWLVYRLPNMRGPGKVHLF